MFLCTVITIINGNALLDFFFTSGDSNKKDVGKNGQHYEPILATHSDRCPGAHSPYAVQQSITGDPSNCCHQAPQYLTLTARTRQEASRFCNIT